MEVNNKIAPSPAAFFSQLGTEESFVMVNLLKFKPDAEYKDGNHPPSSGEEAFRRYLEQLKSLLEENGGKFVKYSEIFGLLIGEVEELWDYILVVEYPSLAVFQKLTSSPEFEKAQVHRLAGLAGQLNIATRGGSLI